MSAILPGMRNRISVAACRALRPNARTFATTNHQLMQGPGTGENFQQANDPAPKKDTANVSKTNEVAVDSMGAWDRSLQETQEEGEKKRQLQAPNREGVWSRSQMPRELAMTGPRFEQTIMEAQPRPYAAIDLIHKQPVRWVNSRTVACDGGGGPLGHPKVYLNLDKPDILECKYCGLPYANVHHKKHLQSLPSTPYPLEPTNDPAQVQMPHTPSQYGEIQGQYPRLRGELEAESIEGGGFTQR